MPTPAQIDTTAYPPATAPTEPDAAISAPAIATAEADIAGLSDRGKVRANNEDNFLVVRFGRYLRTMLTSLANDHLMPDHELAGYGLAVADGMGGMAAGEVASRMALSFLIELVLETPDWIFSQEDPQVDEVIARAVRRFERINQTVLDESRRKPWLSGMGTTLTMACSLGDNMVIAHVGDSPVYLHRRGKLHRLTRDHTMAEEMAASDLIPIESIPSRYHHMLTQCIGCRDDGAEPDTLRLRLENGDRLLLCTDGLTDMVDDAGISDILGKAGDSQSAVRSLIDAALEGGGRDNVTTVVATYRIG